MHAAWCSVSPVNTGNAVRTPEKNPSSASLHISASASRVSEVGPIWPHLQHGSAGVGRDEVTEFLGHFNPQGLAVQTNCPDWKIEVILFVLVDRWIDLST